MTPSLRHRTALRRYAIASAMRGIATLPRRPMPIDSIGVRIACPLPRPLIALDRRPAAAHFPAATAAAAR